MVFSLLATEVPPERRSATLNLVYLPLYVAGIIGPAIGGAMAAVGGPTLPFIAGGVVFFVGAAVVARQRLGRGSGMAGDVPDRESLPDREPVPAREPLPPADALG